MSLKKGALTGLVAGVIWGFIALVVNSVTWVFPFEGSFAHNLISFAFGGAIFGLAAGGFLGAAWRFIPFKRVLPKAVFVSAAIWLVVRIGGAALSAMEPERYHVLTPETIQGFSLAVILGCILGLFLKKEVFRVSPS